MTNKKTCKTLNEETIQDNHANSLFAVCLVTIFLLDIKIMCCNRRSVQVCAHIYNYLVLF